MKTVMKYLFAALTVASFVGMSNAYFTAVPDTDYLGQGDVKTGLIEGFAMLFIIFALLFIITKESQANNGRVSVGWFSLLTFVIITAITYIALES